MKPDNRRKMAQAEEILCEQIARAHCIPINELKSSRHIASTIQETKVGREDKSEEANSTVMSKAKLCNDDKAKGLDIYRNTGCPRIKVDHNLSLMVQMQENHTTS